MASKNPKTTGDNLRRVQAVLNAKYPREKRAVEMVDSAREQGVDDRTLLVDALLELRKRKMREGYTPGDNRTYAVLDPASIADMQARLEQSLIGVQERLVEAVAIALEGILGHMTISAGYIDPLVIRDEAEKAAISTFNLVGNSMKFNPDDDEDE